jgi:hypothetical protein
MTGQLIPPGLLLLFTLLAQGQSGLLLPTYAVSPAVEATMIYRPGAGSSTAELQLLVLWRDEAGWMMKDIGVRNWIGTGGGRQSGEPVTTEIHLGVVNVTLAFEPVTRELSIAGREVPLRTGDNVVLVEGLRPGVVGGNGQGPPYIVGMLHVDPHFDTAPDGKTRPGPKQIVAQEFIRRSPELIEYLQCDASLDGKPPAVQSMKKMCSDYGF